MDEGDLTRAVVASYSGLTQDEAREAGQDAAALVLPARRRLWSLAEKLVPERLAAALRARCGSDDATAREGVRELRMALADWLDPPPVCRWCRAPIRPGDEPRSCPTSRPVCRPSKRRPLGAVARCGTLAFPAGVVSLEVMAATLRVPKGAAKGYDVACDRDARALTVATSDGPPPGRDLGDPDAWQDETIRRMYAAVASLEREHSARETDRVAAVWHGLIMHRDGSGGGQRIAAQDLGARPVEVLHGVKSPALVRIHHAVNERTVVENAEEFRLKIAGDDAQLSGGVAAQVVGGVEGLGERGVHVHHSTPRPVGCQAPLTEKATGHYRSPLPPQIIEARAEGQGRRRQGEEGQAAQAHRAVAAPVEAEDPERIRERIGDWLGKRLRLAKASGAGILAALRQSPGRRAIAWTRTPLATV